MCACVCPYTLQDGAGTVKMVKGFLVIVEELGWDKYRRCCLWETSAHLSLCVCVCAFLGMLSFFVNAYLKPVSPLSHLARAGSAPGTPNLNVCFSLGVCLFANCAHNFGSWFQLSLALRGTDSTG